MAMNKIFNVQSLVGIVSLLVGLCSCSSADYWDRLYWGYFYNDFSDVGINYMMSKVDSIRITNTIIASDNTSLDMIIDSVKSYTWIPRRYRYEYDIEDWRPSERYLYAELERSQDEDYVYNNVLFIRHYKVEDEYRDVYCNIINDCLSSATLYKYSFGKLIEELEWEDIDEPVDTNDIFSIYDTVYDYMNNYPDYYVDKTVYKYRNGKLVQEKDYRYGKEAYVVTFKYNEDETIITKKQIWDENTTSVITTKYKTGVSFPYYEKTIWYKKKGRKKTIEHENTTECIYLDFDSDGNWTSRILVEEKKGIKTTTRTNRRIYYFVMDD